MLRKVLYRAAHEVDPLRFNNNKLQDTVTNGLKEIDADSVNKSWRKNISRKTRLYDIKMVKRKVLSNIGESQQTSALPVNTQTSPYTVANTK